jgi:hypothetical protein
MRVKGLFCVYGSIGTDCSDMMTQALQQIHQEGHTVDRKVFATFSPYWTGHINRFGSYAINKNRQPEPLEHHLHMPPPPIID